MEEMYYAVICEGDDEVYLTSEVTWQSQWWFLWIYKWTKSSITESIAEDYGIEDTDELMLTFIEYNRGWDNDIMVLF